MTTAAAGEGDRVPRRGRAGALRAAAVRGLSSRGDLLAALGGALALFACYAVVFRLTRDDRFATALGRAAVNMGPAMLAALAVYRLLMAWVLPRGRVVQAAAHPIMALGFALSWYLGVMIAYGLRSGWMTEGVVAPPFSRIALTWQLFQGVTLYAVVALFAQGVRDRRAAASLRAESASLRLALAVAEARAGDAGRDHGSRPLLLRWNREIVPVAIGDIVRLSAENDRSCVVTRTGRHATSATLAELADALPDGFIRVHRSHLVAINAILHAEPAGNGRLTLHLPGGDSVTTSRAGARLVRGAVI